PPAIPTLLREQLILARRLRLRYEFLMRSLVFIPPAVAPHRRERPPLIPGWIHEGKFDGFRAQLNKSSARVRLLSKNGNDFAQHYPLIAAAAGALLGRARSPAICPSKGFIDSLRLLAECESRKLEGIVSKRIDAPYRSGDRTDWIKVKSQAGA